MSEKRSWMAGITISLLIPAAQAAELTLSAGGELEWTDNVYASGSDKRNDLLETLYVGAEVEDSDASYAYRVGYLISHERYERDSFDAETYYVGDAFFLWTPLPGRFDWRFAVGSEVTQRSSQGASTPDNRDQRTTYSTTPRLVLLSLPRDNLYLEGNASKVTFREEEGNDSERAGGTLGWQHTLSELTMFSVTGSHEQVTFDDAGDYDRDSYSLGVTRQINGGSISLTGGRTELTPEQGDSFEGTNAAANITWGNDIHLFALDATRDLSDTSAGFGDWAGGGIFSPGEVNTGEVTLVTRTRISLSDTYRFNPTLTLFGMVYDDKEVSEDETTDLERVGVALRAVKNITAETDFRIEAGFEQSDDQLLGREEKTSVYLLAIDKRFDERATVSGWIRRESADNDLDDLDYEVHSIGVSAGLAF